MWQKCSAISPYCWSFRHTLIDTKNSFANSQVPEAVRCWLFRSVWMPRHSNKFPFICKSSKPGLVIHTQPRIARPVFSGQWLCCSVLPFYYMWKWNNRKTVFLQRGHSCLSVGSVLVLMELVAKHTRMSPLDDKYCRHVLFRFFQSFTERKILTYLRTGSSELGCGGRA